NERGEVVGIVTLKKSGANNMGYALHLSEIKTQSAIDPDKVAQLKVQVGPLNNQQLENTTGKPLPPSAWEVSQGTRKEERNIMVLDIRAGQPYWMTTRDPIPENFKLTMYCVVANPANPARIDPTQRAILRTLCVRFSSAEPERNIIEPTGYLFVFSRSFLR